jgi:glycosyltransferase involved in cell wall biosynthesis
MNISYVITVYNKAPYIADVIHSLASEYQQTPEHLEYIFVDDGSSDDSVHQIQALQEELPGEVIIIEQENQGAAIATNVGVAHAKYEWVRLLDGDDIPTKNSTEAMYNAAITEKVDFVIGSSGYFTQSDDVVSQMTKTNANGYVVMSQDEALDRFIKGFSHNSSCMLVNKNFFVQFGGADIRLRSPDYTMALRATAHSEKIVRMTQNVTLTIDEAPGRLSSQIARSRYDSVCAIYYLAHELLPARTDVAKAVYKRASSRSSRYARALNNRPLKHFFRYVCSKLFLPRNLKAATYQCLSAYTPNGRPERPKEWQPKDKKNPPMHNA